MDWWSALSTGLGLFGAVAGVLAAVWVYRRERAERGVAQRQELVRAERERREARDAVAASEAREDAARAREAKRLKYQDDYREFRLLLEEVRDLAYRVEISDLLTDSDARSQGLRTLQERLERMGDRVPALQLAAVTAGHIAHGLDFHSIPDSVDPALRKAMWNACSQYWAAREAAGVLKRASAQLDKEWDG